MKKGKMTAIIQAHMSSSRLPGKVMKDICGEPALYRMIERVRQSKLLDDIVVATSTMDCDDTIIQACEKWGVHTFRGSNDDVLARYWGAAQQYPSDYYARLTSDCPLFDAGILDRIIQYFYDHDYRYVSASLDPDQKFTLADGVGGEVFTADLLEEDFKNATHPYEHEHVTPYMYYTNQSKAQFPYDRDESMYRITLDTPEDYEKILKIYEALYTPGNTFTLDDIIRYLEAHPEVNQINAMIRQKKVKE